MYSRPNMYKLVQLPTENVNKIGYLGKFIKRAETYKNSLADT